MYICSMFNRMNLSPSSFPATKVGYNSYLKSIGINPKDRNSIVLFAMHYADFRTLDRQSLDEKIAETAELCDRMYNNYIDALKHNLKTESEFYNARWSFFSKKFVELCNQKHG